MEDLTILRITTFSHVILGLIICYLLFKFKYFRSGDNLSITYLIFYFFIISLLDGFSLVADFFILNSHFINYFYMPCEFILLTLYLNEFHKSKKVNSIIFIVIISYLFIQAYLALFNEGYNQYNAFGGYFTSAFIAAYSFWNLSLIFKNEDDFISLKYLPVFWFTFSIFLINLFDIIFTFLQSNNYFSGSNDSFFAIGIIRNITKAFLMLGYIKGSLLIQSKCIG